MRKRIDHWFSGRKIPTLGSTVQCEAWQASFSTGTVGPRVGILLSPLNNNDGFYLSHIPISAHGKDKKKQPHVDGTPIRGFIVILKLERAVDGAPSQIPTLKFLTPPAPRSPTPGHDLGNRMKFCSICFLSFICENTHTVWYKNL